MKYSRFVLINVLLVSVVTLGCGTESATHPDWKRIESSAGEYSVLMPLSAKDMKQRSGRSRGVQMHVKNAEFKGNGFTVIHVDLLGIEKQSAETVLDNGRKGAVAQVRGKLVKETKIELNGHPGRDLLVALPSGKGFVRARCFFARPRIYQFIVSTPKGLENSEDVLRFLDSAKIER